MGHHAQTRLPRTARGSTTPSGAFGRMSRDAKRGNGLVLRTAYIGVRTNGPERNGALRQVL